VVKRNGELSVALTLTLTLAILGALCLSGATVAVAATEGKGLSAGAFFRQEAQGGDRQMPGEAEQVLGRAEGASQGLGAGIEGTYGDYAQGPAAAYAAMPVAEETFASDGATVPYNTEGALAEPVSQLKGASPANSWSLRFYGNGWRAPDLDRVKIQIDDPSNSMPGPPVDVGATDFTIEFFVRGFSGENPAAPVSCGSNVNWIYGNIVLDRDRYNQDRKFGISLAGGSVVFGVSGQGTGDLTICGTSNVLDGNWHHIAVQRRRSDGYLWLFVDGRKEAEADGPDGDISYPDDGVPGNYCNGPCTSSDPYLVLGAEKHDAGPAYPSFSGWMDELRVSTVLRYGGNFAVPSSPFVPDAATVGLYHFDEGSGDLVGDSSGAPGGPSNGVRRYGGSPSGPEWSTETPFGGPGQPALCTTRPAAPASRRYFAEGATAGPFETWILLANPGTAPVSACLTLLLPGESRPGPLVEIPAGSRRSVKLDAYVDTYEVGVIVEGSGGAVVAQRAMYSVAPGRSGAHLTEGAKAPGYKWLLPEGATQGGFETWVLLANPDPARYALVDVTLLTDPLPRQIPTIVMEPLSRKTLRLNDYVTTYEVATRVEASSYGAGVVVERATYSSQPGRAGATASVGVIPSGGPLYFAEGATAGPFETWILLANPDNSQTVQANVAFLTEEGYRRSVNVSVPPRSRRTVRVDDFVDTYHVSVRVASIGGVLFGAERAMYKAGTASGMGAATSSGIYDWGWPKSKLAAEGATAGGFETWILLLNPDTGSDAQVRLTYYTAEGPIEGPTLVLRPLTRASVRVNDRVTTYDVSSRVDVLAGPAVIVEESVYSPPALSGDSTSAPASDV
jgi:hypothetical protein